MKSVKTQLHYTTTVTKYTASKDFSIVIYLNKPNRRNQSVGSPQLPAFKNRKENCGKLEWHAMVPFPPVGRATDRKFLAYYSNHWLCSLKIFCNFCFLRKQTGKPGSGSTC